MANTNGLNVLNSWSFIGFGMSHGDVATQPTANGGKCLVFTDPISNKDTYVSISHKLPEDLTREYLIENARNLQVIETQPDAESLARRNERAAQGLPTQMESYVLCPKSEGTRKSLAIDWNSLV